MIITLGLSCPASLCVCLSLSLPISLSLSISLSHSLTAYGQHDLDSRLAGVYRVQVLEERRHAAKLLLEQSTRQFGAGHAAVKRCDADHELSLSLSLSCANLLACLCVAMALAVNGAFIAFILAANGAIQCTSRFTVHQYTVLPTLQTDSTKGIYSAQGTGSGGR